MVVINSNSKLIIQPAEITQHIRVNSNGNLTRTINENGTLIIGTTLDVEYNNVTITGNPSNDRDVATVEYVKNHIQGLDVKESVKCATIVNIIDLSGLIQVDDITVQKGDRVLVKNQNNESQNGIYLADNSVWSRAQDFDAPNEVQGAFVFVEQGTTNAAKGFIQLSNAPVSIGNGPIKFTQFNGTYAFEAGDGVTQVGNTLNVDASLNHVTNMTGLVSIGKVDQDTTFFGAIVVSQGIIGDLSGNASTATAAASSGALRTNLNDLSTSISTEVSKGLVLSTGLVTEASTARSAEAVLSTSISTEASKGLVLSSDLITETSTARSAEAVLSTSISTEVSKGLVLSSRLSTETSTARAAESTLSIGLSTETSTARYNESLKANLSEADFEGNVSIEGTLDISSSLIGLNVNNQGTDAGLLVMRKDASNVLIGWDENEEKFVLGLTNAINSATSEVGIITKGVLLADLSGNAETASNATNSDAVTVDISGELQVKNGQNTINMNRGSYSSKFIIDPSGNLIINIGNQYFRYNLTSASNSYNGVLA